MKIKVLKTTEAASCPLGIYSKKYIEGEVFEIYDKLATVFISQGWGVKFDEPIKETSEEKSIEIDKLENKAINKAPENKSFSKAKSKAKSKK